MVSIIQKGLFVIRFRVYNKMLGLGRKIWWSSLGMKIGDGTVLPKIYVNWPHQVSIGKKCSIGHLIHFQFAGMWMSGPSILIGDDVFLGAGCEFNIRKQINIGSNSLIASGCKFIDHDHGTLLSQLMKDQPGAEAAIQIGTNVWLGCNVIVLKGVSIEHGAIVAAGSVVTKSIPANEIWAGIPARKINQRNSV